MDAEKITTLPRSQIVVDELIQVRYDGRDRHTIDRYIESMRNGDQLPPVRVCRVDGEYVLYSGFHRLAAADDYNGIDVDFDVECWVEEAGSIDEVMVKAATANRENGLPLNRRDTQSAIRRLLALTDWSYREIARQLNVSDKTVGAIDKVAGIRNPGAPITVTRGSVTYTQQPKTAPASAEITQMDDDLDREPDEPGHSMKAGGDARCRECNRILTDEESKRRGIGPCCLNKLEKAAAQDERLAGHRNGTTPPVFVKPEPRPFNPAIDVYSWAMPGDANPLAAIDLSAIEELVRDYDAAINTTVRRGRFVVELVSPDGFPVMGEPADTLVDALLTLERAAADLLQEMAVAA